MKLPIRPIRLGRTWSRLLDDYEATHRDPRNKLCHTIGIPLIAGSIPVAVTVVGLPLAAGMFTVGWGFQFVGHALEGTPPQFVSDRRNLFVGLIWWAQKMGVEVERQPTT